MIEEGSKSRACDRNNYNNNFAEHTFRICFIPNFKYFVWPQFQIKKKRYITQNQSEQEDHTFPNGYQKKRPQK